MDFVEIHGQLEIFLAFTVDFSKLRFFFISVYVDQKNPAFCGLCS